MPKIARWIRMVEKRIRIVKGLEQILRVIEGFERGQGSQFGQYLAKRKAEEMISQYAQEEWLREELVDLHALLSNLDWTEEVIGEAGNKARALIHQHTR